jgi:hypothetical protein
MNSMGLNKTAIAAPLLLALAACSAANGASNNDTTSNSVAPVTANAVSSTALTDTGFKVGADVATIQYWDGSRPFVNLIYGGQFAMQNTNPWGGSEQIPVQNFDANGWVKSVPTGYQVIRQLSIPASGGNFICRFQGNGTLKVQGSTVSNVAMGAGQTTFTLAPGYPTPQSATIAYAVDPTNYIRNIDCREASASTTDTFAPEFLAALQGFKELRFMKWSGVEANAGISTPWAGGTQASPKYPITWTTRDKPGDGSYLGNDGVPVEVMVQLANQAGIDPWFNIPWNADDDYITRYATYVRDNLAAGRTAYIENSNEVWNGAYPVYQQALAEGKAEGLDSGYGGDFQVNIERYAEKSAHVMDIWSNVFAGQTNRIVRVAAFQHVQPTYADMLLKYNNSYTHFDALATAPYFGFDGNNYPSLTADQAFNTLLPAAITDMVNFGVQNKAVAAKYGLRYITYEAGQGITMSNNVTLLNQIEHDSRMADAYKTYISQWQTQVGDLLNLFDLTGPVNQYGAWGMWDYAGQPLSASPKMQGVQQFLGISTTTAVSDPTPATGPTTTTITCPDGTVIDSTSTCPTTSTGSTSGSTSTSPGKRTGSTKGGGRSTKTATA